MTQLDKGKAKTFSLRLMALILVILTFHSQNKAFHHPIQAEKIHRLDTVHQRKTIGNDSVFQQTQPIQNPNADSSSTDSAFQKSVDSFNFKKSKDTLSAPVSYHADDSLVFDIPAQKLFLYGKESTVKYTDNELMAPFIQFDQKTNTAWSSN
jgi:hypothetical protein